MFANSLAPVDPFDQALIQWLLEAPLTWARLDQRKLSRTQYVALERLVESGLIEAAIGVEVTMEGFRHCLSMRYRITGDWEEAVRLEAWKRVPSEWLAEDGTARRRTEWSTSPFREIRLTTNGERVQSDLRTNRGRAFVSDFLSTTTKAPADVEVEDSRVSVAETAGQNAAAQAVAHASVGDVVVNNQINVPATEVVVQVMSAEFANAGANEVAPQDGRQSARQDDTKDDTPRKAKKQLRRMTTAAVDCARLYKTKKKEDSTTTVKSVVEDYVVDNDGSVDSIIRTLNDNPEQWRV